MGPWTQGAAFARTDITRAFILPWAPTPVRSGVICVDDQQVGLSALVDSQSQAKLR